MKRFWAAISLLCLLGFSGGCSGSETPPEIVSGGAEDTLPPLTVTVLNVGKADAILIRCGDNALMVDAGEAKDAAELLEFLENEGVRRLDYLILTHLDKDHIGGAGPLLRAIPVERVIQSHNTEDSKAFADYQAACREKGLTPTRLRKNWEIDWGRAHMRLLPAAQDTYTDDNDYSIMTEMTYGRHRFLLAGDATGARLREYLDGDVQPVDFLKVPHHGRIDPMSAAFLRAVKPDYAAITCSKKKPPDEELLALLREEGSEIYLTTQGHIRLTSNGQTLLVDQA